MTSFFIPRGLRVREADSNPSVIASELVFPNATLSAAGTILTVQGLVVDGDKGDITVSASGATWTIDNDAVTTAKLGGDITAAGKALLDDADASAQRTTLGLGTLATQSGTFSGTSSGTNTGDQTNITGNAATVTTNANLTGHVTSVGNAAVLGSFTKSQLDAAVSDGNVLYVGDAPTSHVHGNITNDGRISIFPDLPVITGTGGVLTVSTFGTTAATFCQGNDSRLSNARTPTAHNHVATEITSGTLPVARLSFTKAELDTAVSDGNVLYVGDVTSNVTHTGDVTGDTALTIANDAVTFAKMQNVSAASRLLGRGSAAGAGDPEEIVLGSGLTMSGTTLSAAGGVGGSTGATDNRVLRADGTGGATLQSTGITVDDSNNVTGVATLAISSTGTSTSDNFSIAGIGYAGEIRHGNNGVMFANNGTHVARSYSSGFATIALSLDSGQNLANDNTVLSRQSAGVVQIGTTANNASGSLALTNLTASGTITGTSLVASSNVNATTLNVVNGANSATATYSQPFFGRLSYAVQPANSASEVEFCSKGSSGGNGTINFNLATSASGNSGNNLLFSARSTKVFLCNGLNYTDGGPLELGGKPWGETGLLVLSGTTLLGNGLASLNGNLTASGTISSTANGAASTPASTLVGTWFTGGDATTTKPQLLVEPTGTTSTAWSTAGTGIGVNAASGFTGNLIDAQVAGVSRVSVSAAGNLTASGTATANALILNGISIINSGGNLNVNTSILCSALQAGVNVVLASNGGVVYFGAAFDATISRNAAGVLQIGTTSNNASGSLALTNLTASGTFRVGGGTVVANILSATATLDFPSIGSNDTETLTITVTGAVAGDSVFLGCPAGLDAGLIFCASVTAADTVTVRMHNSTGGAVDPASATFRATVIRF